MSDEFIKMSTHYHSNAENEKLIIINCVKITC